MKATDLTIGDYVQFFEERNLRYEKVTAITDEGNNQRFIQTAESDVFHLEEVYMPIPLTAEILAKNGMETKDGDEFVLFDNSKIDTTGEFTIIRYYAKVCRLWICKGDGAIENEIHINCQYVHELQHALKLCGIDKQIVL